MDVHVDGGINVPDQGVSYMHCGKCLDEWRATFRTVCSPKQYARMQVAYTHDGGLQVWCTRHEVNVARFTFRAVRTKEQRDEEQRVAGTDV